MTTCTHFHGPSVWFPLYCSHCMVPIVWKSTILPHVTTMVSRQRCRIYDLLTLLYQARIAQQLSLDGWQPWRPHLALVEYVESHLLDRVGQENMRRHVDRHQMSRSYKAIIWHHKSACMINTLVGDRPSVSANFIIDCCCENSSTAPKMNYIAFKI